MADERQLSVLLTGQPNSGKSTLFNALTGSVARVGNYPGITVERMEGTCRRDGLEVRFTDLPGTYSLTSFSLEEVVARDAVLKEKPDAVVCVIDATALERGLYLAVQLMELGAPLIVVLNMVDELPKRGVRIDAAKLSRTLAVPIVECVARRGAGTDALIDAIVQLSKKEKDPRPRKISYGPDLDPVIREMAREIETDGFLTDRYPPRWLALKYLEGDATLIAEGREAGPLSASLEARVGALSTHVEKTLSACPEGIIADYRYGYIHAATRDAIVRADTTRRDVSDLIDRVLTQRLLGPAIMIGALYLMFHLTFSLGAYPQTLLLDAFDFLGGLARRGLPGELFRSLIADGVIDGVGSVLSFTPYILIMFVILVFLEDLGYMARMAYMLDRIFKIFGLHGASIVPFIISGGIPGGCAVPGVLCARGLRGRKERLVTILTAPFMMCGAKVTAFLVLAGAFFPERATLVMTLLTVTAWLVALVTARVLRWTLVRGESTPFVMELPPYRLPTLYGICVHSWERVWQFIKKAGTVIFAVSIIMWALMTFPQLPEDQNAPAVSGAEQKKNALRYSLAGRLGAAMEPITGPAGFNWQMNIALIGGFAAKEVIVATLSTAYSMEEDTVSEPANDGDDGAYDDHSRRGQDLKAHLAADPAYTLPTIIAFFLFILLYAPCSVTAVAIARETNWKWSLLTLFGSTAIAYGFAVLARQIGNLMF